MSPPSELRRDIYRIFTDAGESFFIKASGKEDQYSVIISRDSEETSLEELAEIIEGCFKPESNFFETAKKILVLRCERKIKLVYELTSVLISDNDATAENIIKKWNRKEKRRLKEAYYIITGRKFAPPIRVDSYCKVRACSEMGAIKKVQKKFDWCDCVCLGVYNSEEDALLLKNASKYIDFKKMHVIGE